MRRKYTKFSVFLIFQILAFFCANATSYIPTITKTFTTNTTVYCTDADLTSAGTSTSSWVVIPSNGTSSVAYTNTNGDTNGNPTGIIDNLPTTSAVNMIQIKADGGVYNSSKRVIHMRVSGITGFIAHGQTGSSGRGMNVSANVASGLTETSTMNVVATVTRNNNSGSFITAYNSLSASETYILSIYAVSNDTRFYAIEFFVPSCTTPSSYSVNGTTTITSGNSTNITLSGSEYGVTYQLYKNDVADGSTVPGTGSGLSWTVSPTSTSTYTVKTTTAGGYCETTMNGSAVITVTSNVPVIELTSAAGTDSQTPTVNTAITNITYSIANGTATTASVSWTGTASSSTPPTGITVDFTSPILTISGTPTVIGNYGFTATTDGSPAAEATGSINVIYTSSATDYFRSTGTGGSWATNSTWQSSPDNTNWYSATTIPGATSKGITIQNGTTVTISNARTIGTASTNLVAATIETGGQLDINSGGTLTIASGSSLTVLGTLKNSVSGSPITTTGSLIFANSTSAGSYYLENSAVQMPTATWSASNGSGGTNYGTAYINSSATTPTYSSPTGTYGNIVYAGTASPVKPFHATNNAGITMHNLTITSGSYQLTTSSGTPTYNITGNFTQNGGTFTHGGYAVNSTLNIAGNFIINQGTYQCTFNGATSNLNIAGDVTVSSGAKFIQTTSCIANVDLNGTSLQTLTGVTGTGTSGIINYTISNTNDATLGSDMTINGNLNLDLNCDIIPGSYTLTLNGTTSGEGTIDNTGSSILEYAGTSTQTISNLKNTTLSDLIIDNTAGVTLNTDISATNVLLNPNSKLTIGTGNTLTVGTGITLQSDETGTATLLGSVSGPANVQQYLATTRNWYVSSPVSNAVAPSGYTYYQRDEANSSWLTQPFAAGDAFVPGRGYIALPGTAAETIIFSTETGGSLNSGNIEVTLTNSGESSTGFNLIGNPYPAHLTWTKTFVDNNAAKIEPSIWYRTNAGSVNSGGDAAWSFLTINASTGEVSPLGTTNIIPPMQAFWVKAVAAGTLILDNNLTLSHQAANPLKVRANSNNDRQRIRLLLTNGISTDEALIYFDPAASNGYDRYDSPKMMNGTNSAIPDMFTAVGSEKLVINGLNTLPLNTLIPVYIATNSSTSQNFTLSANELSNIPSDVSVILMDKATETNLSAGESYVYTAPAGTTLTFGIILRSNGTVTGVDPASQSNFGVYANNQNQIAIQYPVTGSDIQEVNVYNAVGQRIANKTITSNLTLIDVPASGVYMVTVNNETCKVIVK